MFSRGEQRRHTYRVNMLVTFILRATSRSSRPDCVKGVRASNALNDKGPLSGQGAPRSHGRDDYSSTRYTILAPFDRVCEQDVGSCPLVFNPTYREWGRSLGALGPR